MATRKKRSGSVRDDLIRAIEDVRHEVRELLDEMPAGTDPRLTEESGIDFYNAVRRYERELIEAALRIADGRQLEAARLLHIGPSTLSSKMKRLRIDTSTCCSAEM